jgi:hypothetical protein
LPADSHDLLDHLLHAEPNYRLGYGGVAHLKAHPFFATVDWTGLERGQAPAPQEVLDRVQAARVAPLPALELLGGGQDGGEASMWLEEF